MSQISNTSKKTVAKKTVVAAEPTVEGPKIKILVAVPACHVNHVKYRQQVVDAVKANFPLNPNVEVTFSVDETPDNSVAETNTWNVVVQKFQELSDRVVSEGFDYLWMVEADVVVPTNALSHLLSDNVDVACGVIPYHFFAQYPQFPVYTDLMTTGYIILDKQGQPTFDMVNLYLRDIQDKLLFGNKEHPIFNGTSCILIKRSVFASGLRWRWDNKVSGFDVYFWKDCQLQGFSVVTDGFVVCD
ncbi:hypothetical protein E4G67_04400, partial [Candidatus Bathyarchaeota archaeon]